MVGIPAKKAKDVTSTQQKELIEHAMKYYQLGLYHRGRSNHKGFE